MSRILILTDWYSPGFLAGGPIQSCVNLANALNDKFQINVLTTDTDFKQSNSYPNIVSNQWIDVKGVSVFYAKKKTLPRLFPIYFLRKSYDIVYLNNMYSWHFTLLPLIFNRLNLIRHSQFILAPRGMLSSGSIQVKNLKKIVFLKIAKIFGIYKKITFHATSEEERLDILKYFPKANIQTISNLPGKLHQNKGLIKTSKNLRLICVSRTSPEKNIHFLIELLLRLPVDFLIDLDIYGLINDPEYYNKCKSLEKKLPFGIKVNYCKPLPHDKLMEKFAEYHFFILTTKGENFGHAIAEALSAGLPVILSDRTPWRNLQNENVGWDLSLENDDLFISVLKEVYEMENIEYQNMKLSALDFFQKRNKSEEIIIRYMNLFNNSINNKI